MRFILGILSTITSIYMFVIFVRILLTWFSGVSYSRPVEILSRITDPYLDFFRRFTFLRLGYLDLSPIAALAVLSLANRIFASLARYGAVKVGIILAMLVQAVWSAAAFLLGFGVIVLILRLIALWTNRNIYSAFWRAIDTISQPLVFRINRIIFGSRIVRYQTGILLSIAVLAAVYLLGGAAVYLASALLARLPI
jgi:YggT family protein